MFILPLSLIFVIPKTSSLPIIYIFKTIIPYGSSCFLFTGLGIYLSIIYRFANPQIINKHKLEDTNIEEGDNTEGKALKLEAGL
jgi:hypothetical protein